MFDQPMSIEFESTDDVMTAPFEMFWIATSSPASWK